MQLKEHRLSEAEVEYGLIRVVGVREHFPPPGAELIVYDDEGKKYNTKMHNTASRIDGLTEWHKTHQTKKGDVVTMTINPDKSVTLSVKKESQTQSLAGTAIEISKLRELQNHFETSRANTEEAKKEYIDSEIVTKQFQEKFSIEKLLSMTLEEYVVGHGSRESFCYWVERQTDIVGRLLAAGAGNAFNVYYSKKNSSYIIQQGNQGKVVSEEEAKKQLEFIKTSLIELLKAAEKKNFEKIRAISKQLPLDQHTIGKIICLYFPEKYLGLFSIRHMDEYLKSFGLLDEKTKNSDAFGKREMLLTFKEQDEIMKNWPNRKYTDFLYKEIHTTKPKETAYFIFRTSGGGYSDQQELKYNFKEGIPGYKQLTKAERNAKFVYLENGLFYGKGKIGIIKSYKKNGTKYFDAQIQNYEKIEPIPLNDIITNISKSLTQAGIMKITEEDYKIITEFRPKNASVYTLDEFSAETGFEKARIKRWEKLLKRKKQIIFQGPPGTGKTFVAQRLAKLVAQSAGLVEIIQFHPDYSYEDFIQGYFPEPGNSILQFNMKKGRFLEFCEKANNMPDTPCVMIIDEINRAKLSRVFGELMYLLEYRDNEIPLASGGHPYKIPENVHLIGTMNTADRSIALVDHALRRRFSFIRLQPEYSILANYLTKNNLPADSLVVALQQINRTINDPNYEVGISFFMKDQTQLKQWLPDIWKTEIEPYLEEYFYDQKSKVESFRWDKLAENNLKEWTE